MTGVQTPLQSGSLASACQSCALGGGLIASLSAALAGNGASRAQAIRLRATMMRWVRFNMATKITGSHSGCQSFGAPARLVHRPVIRSTGPLYEAPARYTKGAHSSFELHAEAAMDPRVALEVLRDGLGTDILDAQVRERLRIELETGVIGREHQAAGRAQQLQRPANYDHMIALHVQHSLHAFGIGESRRIHEDQIEARPFGLLFLQPLQTVCAVQLVLGVAKAVEQ